MIDRQEKLVGVLRVHDLLFPDRKTPLTRVMISSPLSVTDQASLMELQEFFEEHHLFGVPVVDDRQRLIGVVLPGAVEEAVTDMCGFFFVLSFAAAVLHKLGGI